MNISKFFTDKVSEELYWVRVSEIPGRGSLVMYPLRQKVIISVGDRLYSWG